MMGKEEREAENLEKRKKFYDILEEIDFEVDPQKVTIGQFTKKIDEMSFKLKCLCEKTLKDVKGYKTKQQLRNIAKNADELNKSIQNIDLNEIGLKGYVSGGQTRMLDNNFCDLIKAFEKASKAHYPFLIKRSTLDYEGTRKYFLKLAEQVQNCRAAHCALVDEINFSYLKNTLDSTDEGLINISIMKEKDIFPELTNNNLWFCRIKSKDECSWYRLKVLSSYTLLQTIKFFTELHKTRNFSKQIDYLKKVKHKMDDAERQLENRTGDHCEVCGRRSIKSDFTVISCDGGHWMCAECLKTAVRNNFRCPKCDFPVNKSEANLTLQALKNAQY